LRWAAEGVKLAIVARRANLLEEVAALILANGYARPAIIVCDLMREDAATTVANAALAALGSVDILVNNAGGSRKFNLDSTRSSGTRRLHSNFTRQRQLTHALLAQMIAHRWGASFNITEKASPTGSTARSAPSCDAFLGERTFA